jgi:hypothetical protein
LIVLILLIFKFFYLFLSHKFFGIEFLLFNNFWFFFVSWLFFKIPVTFTQIIFYICKIVPSICTTSMNDYALEFILSALFLRIFTHIFLHIKL